MWARKRLDLSWGDALRALFTVCLPTWWKPESDRPDLLLCPSARSAFDLLLTALQFPAGSEVLISAITIPDMVRIIRSHGLVPIPVDLRIGDLSPDMESLDGFVTSRTRMLLVTHLFGIRLDSAPFSAFASRHKILLVQDLAESFTGPFDLLRSSPGADIFSFGPIKTCTALGGGAVKVRDRKLLDSMKEIQESYPRLSRRAYLKRVVKYGFLKAISSFPVYSLLFRICGRFRIDLDHLLCSFARSYRNGDFPDAMRRKPMPALIHIIEDRLMNFDAAKLRRRTERGRYCSQALQPEVVVPGGSAEFHTYWLFPVVSRQPQTLIALLRSAGFDATRGASLCTVDAPEDRPESSPLTTRWMFERVVFVPVYGEIPYGELNRMTRLILETEAAADIVATGSMRRERQSSMELR